MPSTKFLSLLSLAASAIAEARWEIEVAPGKLVTARGIVEQAIAEITARYDPELEAKMLRRAANEGTTLVERSPLVLEARADMNCKAQAQWPEAQLARIDEGIRYLRKVKG
ncbi:hypothetical protein B0T18DRAFT_450183 [Schizothecium vesticola]|uniref:Uncharacterized protein n=1 Tax=Schizothecium vesticola TaxID=314040 RepID=A0AA40EGY0_9PEZI|nr:hypothetical protein B0T18DRAFT_450183 [Schizothecium vesticola]